MSIPVSCPHCGHKWIFKGNESKVYITCPGCYKKVQIKTATAPEVKAPPELKKARARARIGQLPDGATLRGQLLSQATGRVIECETLEVPSARNHTQPIEFKSSQNHSMRLLKGSEVWKSKTEIDVCSICGHKLFEDLRYNVLLDNEKKCHSSCVAELAVLNSAGDLGQASAVWGIPLDVLNKKAQKLIKIIGEENHV